MEIYPQKVEKPDLKVIAAIFYVPQMKTYKAILLEVLLNQW